MKTSLRVLTFAAVATLVTATDYQPAWLFQSSGLFENSGIWAAGLAAPMWHLPTGTCLPSAASNEEGQQTNGVDADNCNIYALDDGCPAAPWYGPNTWYRGDSTEPFDKIPTYYRTAYCPDDASWRVLYYVYFKKDTGHTSDWEGATVIWRSDNGGANWRRDSIRMEQDGGREEISWSDIPNTFSDPSNQFEDGNKYLNYPKLYFGKFHHPVLPEPYTEAFKNTCPPFSADDYRNNDFFFWANDFLLDATNPNILNPSWDWGAATSPANIDPCTF